MAELDPGPSPSLGMLTAPINLKTSPHLHSYLQKSASFFPLQEMIQQTLLSPSTAVARVEDIPDHLHNIHVIHLANRNRLVLKASPSPITPLLRHEHQMLNNEALTLQILGRSDLPVSRLLRYDPTSTRLGSPFTLTTCLSGTPYAELRKQLRKPEREHVEDQLRFLQAAVSQHVSSASRAYGPVVLVAGQQGHGTWREAFGAMLESVLMDAEDLLINLPYVQLRKAVAKLECSLDDVTEPRLVVLGLLEPSNILIDPHTKDVTGMVDFGQALWGDWQFGTMQEADGLKSRLYTIYHSIVTIVKGHYRPRSSGNELDARRRLTAVLEGVAISEKS